MLADAFSKLSIASIVLLILFLVAAVIQLILAFLELEKYRRIEKPLLLGLLTAFAAVSFPDHPLIYIATLFGLIGDILVILPQKKALYYGTLSFYLGFICYLLEGVIFTLRCEVPIFLIVIMIVSYIVMLLFIGFVFGKRLTKSTFDALGIGIYLAIFFALLPLFVYMTSKQVGVMYIALIGLVIFLLSDITIVFTKFVTKFKRYDFFIMLTYLIGQSFIVLGYVLTYLIR